MTFSTIKRYNIGHKVLPQANVFLFEASDRSDSITDIRIHVQIPSLRLNNERFLVPELLFSPSNVGLHQAGLPEAVLQSVERCHPELRHLLLSNILCCGGMFNCPGFSTRLGTEIRALVPTEDEVSFTAAAESSDKSWFMYSEVFLLTLNMSLLLWTFACKVSNFIGLP